MSRGAWVAFGSSATLAGTATTGAVGMVVASCLQSGTLDYAEVDGTATDGGAMDGTARPSDAIDATHALPSGVRFACGEATCSWPRQYCLRQAEVDYRYSCYDQPPNPPIGRLVWEKFFCLPADTDSTGTNALIPAQCRESPTCACFTDADAGVLCSEAGWTVNEEHEIHGCGGCYGSPPARLERLRAVV
ncbi:MAG TPA: hypothetical protein VM925_35495 [Labilithrix sp.]|nr:hypothetical protein [Labilithrix sp.]